MAYKGCRMYWRGTTGFEKTGANGAGFYEEPPDEAWKRAGAAASVSPAETEAVFPGAPSRAGCPNGQGNIQSRPKTRNEALWRPPPNLPP